MIWFTADTHFCHENVIEHSKRPYTSLEEMELAMISAWNASVAKGDVVYHLGDFALSWGVKTKPHILEVFSALNGTKHLIKGNHDRKEVTTLPWASVSDYKELKVDLGGPHKQRIVLCHYALRTWNQMHRGSWMLHGHSHGSLPDHGGKIIDVGIDRFPHLVNIPEVAWIMESRGVFAEDHHQPE